MAFWGQRDLKEPLRQNRWYLEFTEKEGLLPFKFALKECKKPEYEIGVTEHRLLTHTFRYPGLLKWKPITIKMVSALSAKSTLDRAINLLTYEAGYYVPRIAQQQISKEKATSKQVFGNALGLIQINEEGLEVERWTLLNPFISSVNYGTLTYENDNFVEVNFTIQYDWATQLDDERQFKTTRAVAAQ
jgi:hypothetical protein